jgi:mevalonate kinase
MTDLIAEARSKIKPVIHAMSKEELNKLIVSLDQAKKNNQIVISNEYYKQVLEKIGISHEELRKIQDKHYEIDVEFELTRDLYEKQRVVDAYLEAHQEDNQLLN